MDILFIFGEREMKNYQQGIEDAWNLAKMIVAEPIYGGLSNDEIRHIFGYVNRHQSVINNSYEEAKEKIDHYFNLVGRNKLA